MTTIYHTAITTGAAANAATINTPLGALDAAVAVLDDRIDDIIAGSETSSTETVDARDGYSVLLDRVRRSYLISNVLLVDAGFTSDSAGAKRYTTIGAAMAAAAAGAVILVAPGVYSESVTFAQNDIKLIGTGAAGYNSSTTSFGTGTIINGRINLNSKVRCSVRDLTVNVSGSLLDGIISDFTTGSTAMFAEIRNVVIVGSGPSAAVHGVLLQTGGQNIVDNVRVYNIGHGVAIRSSYNNVSNIYAENCKLSAIIVKSDTGSGDATNVNLFNVVINTGEGIVIQSAHASYATRHVNIANVTAFTTDTAAISIQQTAGTVELVGCTNCQSNLNQGAGGAFEVPGGGNEITFAQCMVNYPTGYGFKNGSGTKIKLLGCTVQNSPGAKINGNFAMTGTNGAVITSAAGKTSGAFSLANSTWTTITGLAALVDLTGLVASTYITIPATGKYRITGRVIFASNSTGLRGVGFYDTGAATAYAQHYAAAVNGQETVVYTEWIADLTAATGIQLQGYQSSGGALNAQAGTMLAVEMIEAT